LHCVDYSSRTVVAFWIYTGLGFHNGQLLDLDFEIRFMDRNLFISDVRSVVVQSGSVCLQCSICKTGLRFK